MQETPLSKIMTQVRSPVSKGGSPETGMSRMASSPSGKLCGSPFRQNRHPFLIGVAGGTASGKTTVCDLIMQRLNDQCVVILSQVGAPHDPCPCTLPDLHPGSVAPPHPFSHGNAQDSFYRSLDEHELELAASKSYDFDAPEAFDQETMMNCLQGLKKGQAVNVPHYNFITHSR
jgi:uridine kinase